MKLELDGERVKIRKLKISDARDIYENVKDKDIGRWMFRFLHPYPKDEARKFIRRTHYKLKKKKGYDFGIVLKNTNKVIGVVDLFDIDWENKKAEIGYWLGKKYWGRGLMTEAVKLILKFGFEDLKLHRIYARLFEENIGSKNVLEKCGFKLEGIIREATFRNNKWHNGLIYGILKPEYEKLAAP
ncbi:MAG: GNAT family N-acetyltransferase [Candidatus Hodarchaeota archaeon]